MLGIDIELHLLFIALIVSFLALDLRLGALWIMAFFFVALHELCHAVVAKRNKIRVRKIILWPIGGMAVMDTTDIRPGVEFRMAIVGPLFNLAVAGAVYLIASWLGYPILEWSGQLLTGKITLSLFQLFLLYSFYINLVLGVFNLLLPAFPLDGGRVLRSLLASRMEYVKATHYSQLVSLGISFGLFAFAALDGDLWLMLIAMFIAFAGMGEYQATLIHKTLSRVPLSTLVSKDYVKVRPSDKISQVARVMMRKKKSAVLVGDAGMVADLNDLSRAKPDQPVSRVARNVGHVAAGARTEEAYRKLSTSGALAMPVVSRGKLSGIIYRADFEKTIRILTALRKR